MCACMLQAEREGQTRTHFNTSTSNLMGVIFPKMANAELPSSCKVIL